MPVIQMEKKESRQKINEILHRSKELLPRRLTLVPPTNAAAADEFKVAQHMNGGDGSNGKHGMNGVTHHLQRTTSSSSSVDSGSSHAVLARADSSGGSEIILEAHERLYPADRLRGIMEWKGIKKIGRGLVNLGNTCFANSVLQCLTYTPGLANYCLSGEHSQRCRTNEFCAMCEMETHIKSALDSASFGHKAYNPAKLMKKLRLIGKQFRLGRQEDSHEFLRYLVDSLQNSLLRVSRVSQKEHQLARTTFIHTLFGGYFRSEVHCLKCNHKSWTYDPILDISLEIARSDSLDHALKRFSASETLDGDNKYKCDKCKTKVVAKKQMTLYRCPKVLVMQLKRFEFHGFHREKIKRFVSFPEKLNVASIMSPGAEKPAPLSLYAVLVHQGQTTRCGHYFCFVRNSNDSWYEMNDDCVRQVSKNVVFQQQAYILFYRQEEIGAGNNNNNNNINGVTAAAAVNTANGLNGSSQKQQQEKKEAVVVAEANGDVGVTVKRKTTEESTSKMTNGIAKESELKKARSGWDAADSISSSEDEEEEEEKQDEKMKDSSEEEEEKDKEGGGIKGAKFILRKSGMGSFPSWWKYSRGLRAMISRRNRILRARRREQEEAEDEELDSEEREVQVNLLPNGKRRQTEKKKDEEDEDMSGASSTEEEKEEEEDVPSSLSDSEEEEEDRKKKRVEGEKRVAVPVKSIKKQQQQQASAAVRVNDDSSDDDGNDEEFINSIQPIVSSSTIIDDSSNNNSKKKEEEKGVKTNKAALQALRPTGQFGKAVDRWEGMDNSKIIKEQEVMMRTKALRGHTKKYDAYYDELDKGKEKKDKKNKKQRHGTSGKHMAAAFTEVAAQKIKAKQEQWADNDNDNNNNDEE